MKIARLTLPLAVAFILAGSPPTAAAQNGPPPHVVSAVDAVVALARSAGDDAIQQFIDEAMNPSAVDDRDELRDHLASIRDAVSGLTDQIGVENDGSGPIVVFMGASGERHVRLDVTRDGIRGLTIVEPDPSRFSGREGAVRGHIRAIERLGDAEFPEALDRFDEDHFAPFYLETTSAEHRLQLLRAISEAAADARGVGVEFDGSRYTIRFSGPVTHDVMMEVQPNAPWNITDLELQAGEAKNPE
ncbi:MAG: hypothetical protein HKN17_05595 [Rhodothermales bacterium]|nr:hypothetical protein [Rhodothermales bacterium]